jgi:hypothetical protein
MARIVTTVHRYKRPPRKRKAVAITGPAIVRKADRIGSLPIGSGAELLAVSPANDDRKPAIVTTTSRKWARLLRFEQAAEPDDDPEATARVRAFLDRMIRPR